ncbi:PrsW family glutamic-type intramembrane protease [Streptomyces sp. NBC_00038]|uniref:PrsW family glutamic-type intramembrane protease n=1 Tax=Streptomyces sp. NBC_00038 TaxID=2903615 RepID=UPI002252EC00|nr:PrsW family glutamic-type intramembrane protease [Streptomyces sp. NBC_00038]MCX5554878.1 PrsW family glutamic-type intramembrane protease [Streptomyces sp. NBC_00038]
MSAGTGVVPPRPKRPPVARPGMAGAIVVAVGLSVAYAIGQILFWSAPELRQWSNVIIVFLPPEPAPFKVTRVLLLTGWGVAVLLGLWLFVIWRNGTAAAVGTVRACQFGILGALLLPFAVMPLDAFGSSLPQLLLCLLTTGAALLLVHRVQLLRRLPGWLLLAGLGWGALISGGLGIVMITWYQRYAPGFLLDWESPQATVRTYLTLMSLNAALVTELGKAAGVAVLFFLFRRHFDGVVSGVVVGAAVGLGYNLAETVHFMSLINVAHHPTQFWDRQVVGLMATHVAFTALAGAGIGAARWLTERRDRLLVVGGGLLAAVGGHFETDMVLMHLDKRRSGWFGDDDTLSLLLGVPLLTVLTSGIFVVLYVLVLRRGLRAQAAGVGEALRAEAASGQGAVTEPEIGLLLSPRRRLLLELRVWRRDGTAGLRHLLRFQQAQLDLAVQRWHRTRPGADTFIPSEHQLRQKVMELKGTAMPLATREAS